MRVRWSRVFGAVVGVMGGVPALGMTALWLTGASPSPLERAVPGPGPCTTSEVLEGGLALYTPVEGLDESDRLAADVLLGAARCANVEEVDWQWTFEVFQLSRDGLAWIAAKEHGQEALDHALDVWELAADQRRAGGFVNAAVWSTLASEAHDVVEAHLFEVGPDERAAAVGRLVAIAAAPLDWDEVAARDERSMWQVTWMLLATPRTGAQDLLMMPWSIVQSRNGSHRVFAGIRDDAALARVEAAVLAGAAELSFGAFDGADGCPKWWTPSPDLRATGVRLTLDPELCVVAGVHGDQARMASPWTAVLKPLRAERAEE